MENSYQSIEFIFAKPYREHYYLYGVNSIDDLSVILKDDLRKLLFEKLECNDSKKMEYLLERNLAFLYETKSKTIKKFKDITPDLTQEDIGKKFIHELHRKSTYHPSTSLSEKCRHLFGR